MSVTRGDQRSSPMTEHCHLLGTAGTGAHPRMETALGTAPGTGSSGSLAPLSPRRHLRTTIKKPSVMDPGMVAATVRQKEGGHGCGVPTRAAPCTPLGPASSPLAACAMALQFQTRGITSKPQDQALRAVLGSRAGSLSHSLPRSPPGETEAHSQHTHRGLEAQERWVSPLPSFRPWRPKPPRPLCPLSPPARGRHSPAPALDRCPGSVPAPAGWLHPSCPPASPQCPRLCRWLMAPEHGADVELTGEFGFSSWGVLFFPCWLPFSALTPWPRGLG